ncbi:MAG: hypothetical protein AAGE52_10790 [Myxococcota bacterium]
MHRLIVDVARLEVARGYDGWLGRNPSPVLISAAYSRTADDFRLMNRLVHRFDARKPFPETFQPNDPRRIEMASVYEGPLEFLVLLIALEQDGGVDVQRLFGAVDRPDSLSVWREGGSDIELQPLRDAPTTWSTPQAVHLLVGGSDAGRDCKSDKWIGASLLVVPASGGARTGEYRFNVLSPDERNDWTAVLSVRH